LGPQQARLKHHKKKALVSVATTGITLKSVRIKWSELPDVFNAGAGATGINAGRGREAGPMDRGRRADRRGAGVGLTALEPYKPYVAAVTLALLGYGFWHVYFKPKPPCEDGSYCARPQSARTTKIALWLGLAVVIIALTLNWWAPHFY
jgi:hypothetical protein